MVPLGLSLLHHLLYGSIPPFLLTTSMFRVVTPHSNLDRFASFGFTEVTILACFCTEIGSCGWKLEFGTRKRGLRTSLSRVPWRVAGANSENCLAHGCDISIPRHNVGSPCNSTSVLRFLTHFQTLYMKSRNLILVSVLTYVEKASLESKPPAPKP